MAVVLVLAASCSGPAGVRPSRNVILMVADGCSTGALSLSRWYKQYVDSTDAGLNLDPWICGLMRMSHVNAPIAGSAGSMTTLMTGEMVKKQNICCAPKAETDGGDSSDMMYVDPERKGQPLANLVDVARAECGKRIGVVVSTYYCHATPAATAAHAYDRSDYGYICPQMASSVDVLIGGGTKYLDGKTRAVLAHRGVTLIESDYGALRACEDDRMWAVLAPEDVHYDIDRTPDEPSLAEMTAKALSLLSRGRKGFFLMVEGSKVDFAAHANDPVGVVSDVLAFDEAVGVALEFARRDGNTTVVITTDHGTGGVVLGDRKYSGYNRKNVATALGDLPKVKASASWLSRHLSGLSLGDVRDTLDKYLGFEISDEEFASVRAAGNKVEDDYMEVANTFNLQSVIGKLICAHSHVGFASGNHTGEDVFYAVYDPHGGRPEGFITNLGMSAYLSDVMGLPKRPMEYTQSYFVPCDVALKDVHHEMGKDEYGDPSLSITLSDGSVATVISNTASASVQSPSGRIRDVELDVPAVYVGRTGTFYVPGNILESLK